MLSFAKSGLAKLGKNGGDGQAGALDNAFVQIGVNPTSLAREQARDGGFAGAHEAGERDETAGARGN